MDAGRDDDAVARAMNALRRLVGALRTSGAAASGELGMSVAQIFALRVVGSHPGLAMGELAAHTLTSPSAISEVVSRLEQRGFVRRHAGAGDARRVMLDSTAEGRALLDRIGETLPERLIAALSAMSPDERRIVALALEGWVATAGLSDAAPHLFGEERANEPRPTASPRKRQSVT